MTGGGGILRHWRPRFLFEVRHHLESVYLYIFDVRIYIYMADLAPHRVGGRVTVLLPWDPRGLGIGPVGAAGIPV